MRNALQSLIAALCLLAGAARAQNPLLELVTAAADAPSFLADPNDGTGRLFISELGGRIRILAGGTLQDPNDAFLQLDDVAFGGAGEGGLHSFAFDPNFATNRRIFVAYTRDPHSASPLETVIASYTAMAADPNHADLASRKEVLTQLSPAGGEFSNHKGGQLQFGPDGMLYFAFGDGGSGNDPNCLSQTRNVLFGKMLRIDPNGNNSANGMYGVPSTNPFANDPNYAPEIWALGLRNPYRFSFDRDTGDLWIGDVGQSAREEIDMEPGAAHGGGGRNYGWKVWEGRSCNAQQVSTSTCPSYVSVCANDQSPMAPYTAPVADYERGVGTTVIGGFVYRGNVSTWQGRYIFADHGSHMLFALVRNGQSWDRLSLPSGGVGSPLSLGEDRAGDLYVMNDAGSVYRLRFDQIANTKTQQACVRKLNDRFSSVAKTKSFQVRACIDKAARGKLEPVTVDECSADDPKGTIEKIRAKTQATDTEVCTPLPPEVGYAGTNAGVDAAIAAELDIATDVLGGDLDAAVIPTTGDTKRAALCQKSVLTALATCQRTRRDEFIRCKTLGLQSDTLISNEALAACLGVDPKARIAKACDATSGKIAARVIAKSCTSKGVDLATAFPGCGLTDPAALATCLDIVGRCRNCELFDAADALGTDCAAACPP